MNWEETILALRTNRKYDEILFNSYLNDDPIGNVERYRNSTEFIAIQELIKNKFPETKSILEIGSGTGMAATALALSNYTVTATDPSKSIYVGCGAIEKLKSYYKLSNLAVVQAMAEKLPFEKLTFDLVFIRQAMHHAEDLKIFTSESARVMKSGAGFIAVREHVVFNQKDKNKFLQIHPLHSWYEGENAYRLDEYRQAMINAGLTLDIIYKHFQSPINYYPLTANEINELTAEFDSKLNKICATKFGAPGKLKLIQYLYRKINRIRFGSALDERRIPGRMYSFVAHK